MPTKMQLDRSVREYAVPELEKLIAHVQTNFPQYLQHNPTIVFDSYDKRPGSDPNGQYFSSSEEVVVYRANQVEDNSANILQTLLHELQHNRMHKNADSKLGRDNIFSDKSYRNRILDPIYGHTEESKARGKQLFEDAKELGFPSLSIGGSSELVASVIPAMDQLKKNPEAKGRVVEKTKELYKKYPEELDALYFANRYPEDPTPTHIDIKPSVLDSLISKFTKESPIETSIRRKSKK